MTAAPGNRILLVATLIAILAAPALAQTPFASQALGQNVEMNSARDVGRGGWGMADSDTLAPGTKNEAALADLEYSGLFFSGYGETTKNLEGGVERRTYRVVVPNIRLALPIQRGRLVAHAGFLVKRSMEWSSRTELEIDHFDEIVYGNQHYLRTGTLYQVPVGLAWRPMPGLALGAAYNVVRGSIEDQISQVFTDPLDNYYLLNIRGQRDDLSGTCYTGSVLLDGLGFLQIGASYTTAYDLTMNREVNLSGVSARAFDLFNGSMPAETRAGLMIRLSDHWRFGADGQYAAYSKFNGRPDWDPIMEDEWTLSAGVERTWERTKFGRSYNLPVRAGFLWRQWAHTVNGQPVTERTISAGTGFPFSNRLGMIDISLSYSWIGSEAENGYRSNSLRLGLSLTGLEPLVF